MLFVSHTICVVTDDNATRAFHLISFIGWALNRERVTCGHNPTYLLPLKNIILVDERTRTRPPNGFAFCLIAALGPFFAINDAFYSVSMSGMAGGVRPRNFSVEARVARASSSKVKVGDWDQILRELGPDVQVSYKNQLHRRQ